MRRVKEDPSYSSEQAIDIMSAVKELHRLSSQDLNKLLRDSENFTINFLTEKGSPSKIEGEKLARCLHLHLMAVIASAPRKEALFRYLLCGTRLLHSLVDVAPRHSKLEQILLDDVKVSKQLLDLVFHLLIILGAYKQENQHSSPIPLMHSALVACSLYLLTGFICPQWQDLAVVLLAHPKVDSFMDLAVGAVRVNIKFVQIMLSAEREFCIESNISDEQMLNYLCHQCEASLQLILSLCQQKMFRERLLRNQNLCQKGGILFLAQAILQLNITEPFVECSKIVSALSRMKSKVLSILLHLCEADSISFLDEASSSPNTLGLVKSVTSEVLDLLKIAFTRGPGLVGACADRTNPMGLLQLSAMRLADIFSDDSNLRSYVTICFTEVLAAIFSLSHEDFVSAWCSSHRPVKEEEATLEYDLFAAAGWVLDTLSSTNPSNISKFEFTLVPSKMPQASYSHQRSSLFVKLIANLHCFVPNVCEEQERNLFIHKFLECLQMDPSKTLPGFSFSSDVAKAATVCRNLSSLLSHAESLTPIFLNEEDVQLLRVFFNQLQSLISTAELETKRVHECKFEESTSWEKFPRPEIQEEPQEVQSTGGGSAHLMRKEPLNFNNKGGNMKETVSENSAFLEENQSNVGSRPVDQDNDVKDQDQDKDKPGRTIYGGLREMDEDTQNVETSGSDTSSTRGKNSLDQMENGDFQKLGQHSKESGSGSHQEDEKVEPTHFEKQRRKRKRTIMNDKQITIIERALIDEPDMQRNASSIQSWADKLSHHGSEVTSSQLKNWLNNRKARLARAAKDVRAPADNENAFPDRQGGSILGALYDSPESTGEEFYVPPNRRGVQSRSRTDNPETSAIAMVVDYPEDPPELEAGQHVMLVDGNGMEIAKGKVYQVQGKWYGRSLEELGTSVVDINELKVDRRARLMYPCDATGNTFDEAEMKLGVMRVLWDMGRICNPGPNESH